MTTPNTGTYQNNLHPPFKIDRGTAPCAPAPVNGLPSAQDRLNGGESGQSFQNARLKTRIKPPTMADIGCENRLHQEMANNSHKSKTLLADRRLAS